MEGLGQPAEQLNVSAAETGGCGGGGVGEASCHHTLALSKERGFGYRKACMLAFVQADLGSLLASQSWG